MVHISRFPAVALIFILSQTQSYLYSKFCPLSHAMGGVVHNAAKQKIFIVRKAKIL
jgi:hypothetical protein